MHQGKYEELDALISGKSAANRLRWLFLQPVTAGKKQSPRQAAKPDGGGSAGGYGASCGAWLLGL